MNKNSLHLKSVLVAAIALGLTACAGTAPFQEPPKALTDRALTLETVPRVIAPISRVSESDEVLIPVTTRKVSEYTWLRDKKVNISAAKGPIPLSEILRSLSRQGLSITSELPLDRFSYSGFSLSDIDAESALRAIVSSVGLDYQVDDVRRLVMIKPLSSKTWYLNIGNRRSNFSAGGTTSTAIGKGGLGGDSGLSGSGGGNVTSVSSQDDFWPSLKSELDARLKLMVPDPSKSTATAAPAAVVLPPVAPTVGGSTGIPPLPTMASMGQAPTAMTSDGLLNFVSKTVGTYSVNPETGAVSVQAPHWILEDLNTYFKRIQDMYNTDLLFQGELILLTTDKNQSEGLDVTAFARFAESKYGISFASNALGGITLSGPSLGVTADSFTLLNAYLANLGTLTTLQKPMLATTSGVPADFRRVITKYFNSVSQQSSASNGSAATATQNLLIPQDFGTVLRVNPRVDTATGLIRAQIELVQTTQQGTQTINQTVSGSFGTVTSVPSVLPIISKVIYSGEALLKNGDMVVMGGQVEDEDSDTRNGVTGLMDHPVLGPVFGVTTTAKKHTVFYFALRVNVNKR